ncbi:HEAT repeat domain-containing protein [Singulisphaera acidiphila]|uniref:PBS lyase HEAT-like repeat protein n=1 Tax=Singulisphaera acidiphila (strain ATCC BAA-1392 / DSM 18658 / VKM B-2454 / MOB10) TaxID=886293 RepID=L0DL17_SINAD|nr:HEAT repeat domain-containing protein [Singulisphaera acidiphila]AGA29351.1 PBS lyase HEAT-like repeat protein [Singulisphaera acidiphila DSM 18658]
MVLFALAKAVEGEVTPMSRMVPISICILATALMTVGGSNVRASDDPAIDRGLTYLRQHISDQQAGETALIALAFLKGDVPLSDPAVTACFAKLRQRFPSSIYTPERSNGHEVYEAAVIAMALANLDAETRRSDLNQVAQFLIGRQKANGSWDYPSRTNGDTSISQYAVLGLWEAENGGARVPASVWDRAAQWFMSTQGASGAWRYHSDEAGQPETISMTAAGVGSLLICKRQLAQYRLAKTQQSSLLIPLTPEGTDTRYEVKTPFNRIDQSIGGGMNWLSSSFTTSPNPIVGPSIFYGLYGIERIGALADKSTLGRIDWYERGRAFIHSSQTAHGAWSSAHGEPMNTVWAILFLSRSTAKTLRRIEVKRLGAGTLLGGRGLPTDLSSMTVAGGRVVSRPMNGAVEGMLAVLEDPRAQFAESALSGLVTRYETEGPAVLRPHKERFRKLLASPDQGLRRAAAWALGRTGDLDAVPPLIGALTDPDDEVVATARLGLQLLSRKIDGLGPPSTSTPAQRQEAASRWKAWYETIRPLELNGQSDEKPDPTATSAAPGPASKEPR